MCGNVTGTCCVTEEQEVACLKACSSWHAQVPTGALLVAGKGKKRPGTRVAGLLLTAAHGENKLEL